MIDPSVASTEPQLPDARSRRIDFVRPVTDSELEPLLEHLSRDLGTSITYRVLIGKTTRGDGTAAYTLGLEGTVGSHDTRTPFKAEQTGDLYSRLIICPGDAYPPELTQHDYHRILIIRKSLERYFAE